MIIKTIKITGIDGAHRNITSYFNEKENKENAHMPEMGTYHHMNCAYYDEEETEDNKHLKEIDPEDCECQGYTDFDFAFESPEFRQARNNKEIK